MTADRARNDVVVRLRRHLDRATQDWDSRDDDIREAADALEAAAERERSLREALIDATAHLIAAASAYRKHASRHSSHGRATPDALFGTRIRDFENAAERARAALADGQPEQEQT